MINSQTKYLSTVTVEYVQNVYVALDGTLRKHNFPRGGLWKFDGQFFYLPKIKPMGVPVL